MREGDMIKRVAEELREDLDYVSCIMDEEKNSRHSVLVAIAYLKEQIKKYEDFLNL